MSPCTASLFEPSWAIHSGSEVHVVISHVAWSSDLGSLVCPVVFLDLKQLMDTQWPSLNAIFLLKAAVEWSLGRFAPRIHADVPVIQGDICEVQTLIKVKEACPQLFCLMAGVSCQPYSNRGGLHGGKDIRAGTVPAVRQTFRLLQVPRLILECVPPVRTNEFVRQDLQHLCQTMDMQSCECTLKLEDTWAANYCHV